MKAFVMRGTGWRRAEATEGGSRGGRWRTGWRPRTPGLGGIRPLFCVGSLLIASKGAGLEALRRTKLHEQSLVTARDDMRPSTVQPSVEARRPHTKRDGRPTSGQGPRNSAGNED